ncbi:beta-eliminating lyase-related protein [Shigella flexneri]
MPYIVATITSNSAQVVSPVPLANVKAMYSIAKKYDIPVVMDSARFAENAYFIKQREAEYKDWTISRLPVKPTNMPICWRCPPRKMRWYRWLARGALKTTASLMCTPECRTLCAVQEGFPTYGGLKAARWSVWRVGLYDGMNLDWLAYRIAQVQYLVDGLEEIWRCLPAGGRSRGIRHAGKLLPHIPADQFPAQALACELDKVACICVEIGSFLLGWDLKTGKQLPCRLKLPFNHSASTYTQTHMDFIIEAFKHVKENAANIKGLTFTYEPKVLRHFTAKLKEV